MVFNQIICIRYREKHGRNTRSMIGSLEFQYCSWFFVSITAKRRFKGGIKEEYQRSLSDWFCLFLSSFTSVYMRHNTIKICEREFSEPLHIIYAYGKAKKWMLVNSNNTWAVSAGLACAHPTAVLQSSTD